MALSAFAGYCIRRHEYMADTDTLKPMKWIEGKTMADVAVQLSITGAPVELHHIRNRSARVAGTVSRCQDEAVLGVFDSGLGGLTVLGEIHRVLPELDTLYLGDNARAPYGDRDHDTIYRFAWEGVHVLLENGCPLVIVACNTAAAQALRRIQQEHLPREFPDRRVLGVIRPSAEAIAGMMHGGHIGVIGTTATVTAGAYTRELKKSPRPLRVTEVSAPDIAALLESGTTDDPVLEHAVRSALSELLARDPAIDTVLLGCTHFPWIQEVFRRVFPPRIALVTQGPLVADSLRDYLRRHPDISARLSRAGRRRYLTTGTPAEISRIASELMQVSVPFESAGSTETARVPERAR